MSAPSIGIAIDNTVPGAGGTTVTGELLLDGVAGKTVSEGVVGKPPPLLQAAMRSGSRITTTTRTTSS
jgi:hypothetical protein